MNNINIRLDPEQKQIWTEQGLERLRYEYDLNENSVVYDIGASEGIFLKEIWDRYHCNIFAFEPLKSHYNNILKLESSKIRIFNYAITEKKGDIFICLADESRFSRKRNIKERCQSLNINDILIDCDRIDLMKINIEGGEYDLIDAITFKNLKKIKNIQIQFHIVSHNSKKDRDRLIEKLETFHNPTYSYPFCWENWQLKS